MNVLILMNVRDSYAYPGLIIAVAFFMGVIAVLQSPLGLKPGMGPLLFFMTVLPEFVNLFVVEPAFFSSVMLASLGILFYFEKSLNAVLRTFALTAGMVVLQLAKLDVIGNAFLESAQDPIRALGTVGIMAFLLVRYNQSANSDNVPTESLLDLATYNDYLRNALGTSFKIRNKLEEKGNYTNAVMRAVELTYPYIKAYGSQSSEHRISLIQLYDTNGAPVLECSNIALNLSLELEKELRDELAEEEYALFYLNERGDHFSIAPAELASRWGQTPGKVDGKAPIALTLDEPETASVASEEPAEETGITASVLNLGKSLFEGMRAQKPANGDAFDFANLDTEISFSTSEEVPAPVAQATAAPAAKPKNENFRDRIIGLPEQEVDEVGFELDTSFSDEEEVAVAVSAPAPALARPNLENKRPVEEPRQESVAARPVKEAVVAQEEKTELAAAPQPSPVPSYGRKIGQPRTLRKHPEAPKTQSVPARPAATAPKEEKKEQFSPNGGRPLTRLRSIPKEGGSTDFQWNVPSK